MREITKALRGHYVKMTIAPLCKLIEAIFELMVPLVVARIINVGIATGDFGFILWRGAWLLGLALLGIIFSVAGQYFAAEAAAQVGRTLRARLLGHVMALSHEQAGRFGAGRLINLVTGDVAQFQNGLNRLIRLGARVPFLAIGGVVMALILNPAIGLIFLGSTLLLSLTLYLIIRHLLPAYGRIQAEQDDLSRLTREKPQAHG